MKSDLWSSQMAAQLRFLHFNLPPGPLPLAVGQHQTPFVGEGGDFTSLRSYVPGDDVRHIDWRAHGRLGRYLVREYTHHHSETFLFVLDGSGSMGYAPGSQNGPSKWLIARQVILGLIHMALSRTHRVGLCIANTAPLTFFAPQLSTHHFQRLHEALKHHTPQGHTQLQGDIGILRKRLRAHTHVVLVSDMILPESAMTATLKAWSKSFAQVTCLQLLAQEEVRLMFDSPLLLLDLEDQHTQWTHPATMAQRYQKRAEAARNHCATTCRKWRIAHHLEIISAKTTYLDIVTKILKVRRKGRFHSAMA